MNMIIARLSAIGSRTVRAYFSRPFSSKVGGSLDQDHPKTPKGRFDTSDSAKTDSTKRTVDSDSSDKMDNVNPYTGEVNGPKGPEPTRLMNNACMMNTDSERKSLSFDDVMCPVCLDVVIEPVTMSCKHELCKECYTEHFKTCDFFCPICKKRLSTWARKAIATGTLVNEEKWLLVQKEYPDLVSNRKKGNTNPIFLQYKRQSSDCRKISRPGEVNAEYAAMREQWLHEESAQKRLEEEASLELIKKIQEEERKELELARLQQQQADERLATQLSKDLEMKVTPSKVNKIILRPRRSLSSISDNVPHSSRTTPYTKSRKVAHNKRKRKPSEEF